MPELKKEEPRFSRVLFPTDFSEVSEGAAMYAAVLVREFNAKLHVLHVVDQTEEAAGFYVPHTSYEKLDGYEERAEEGQLREFCDRAFSGIKELERIITMGKPHKEVLKAVKDRDIDLIVMGAARREGVGRVILGSTAEKVMRKALVPILVIPSAG